MIEARECRKCGVSKRLTSENFSYQSSGNLRHTCKICMAANTRRLYHKDPAKQVRRVGKYKAERDALIGSHTREDLERKWELYSGRCPYCGCDLLMNRCEKDHILPVSRGGDNSGPNVIMCCRNCNRDKRGKTAEEFMKWRRERGEPLGTYPLEGSASDVE